MSQERTLNELKDTGNRSAAGGSRLKPEEPYLLIPTKDGFVRFSTKLIEEKIVSRTAMKAAPSKSILDGNLTANQSLDAASELLNEMQRMRGGDTVEEDESRYLVKVTSADGQNEWSGEVTGPP